MNTATRIQSCIVLLTIFSSRHLNAQTINWTSMVQGLGSQNALDMCKDGAGNMYITGRTSNATVGDSAVTVHGMYDIYLAKYDPNGIVQWVRTAGGSDQGDFNERDQGRVVLYDSISDAIYLCGSYQGEAIFNGNIVANGQGAFLARYSTIGTLLWVETTDRGGGGSIATDASGAVYFTGASDLNSPNTTFNSDPAVTISSGPFIAKYSSMGELIWAKHLGSNVAGYLLETLGHVYYGGWANGESSTLLGLDVPHAPNLGVAFVAYLDTSFTTIDWLSTYTASGGSVVHGIKRSQSNGAILCGLYQDSLFLNNDTIIGDPNEPYPFVIDCDNTGSSTLAFTTNAKARSVVASTNWENGGMYIGYHFNGSFALGSETLTSLTDQDFAIIHLSDGGNMQIVFQGGPVVASNFNLINTIDNSVISASRFTGTLDLGQGHVLSGNEDVFIAKFNLTTSISAYSPGSNGHLLIYANPNTGTCTIDLSEELANKNGLVLRVLDSQGRVIQETPLRMEQGTIQLDIRAQAKGTYVAEVGNSEVRYTGRIVFE